MLLHTLNKASDTGLKQECTQSLGPEDALLLMEDAVLAVRDDSWRSSLPCPLYVLEADIQARGLGPFLPEAVACIDYAGFVSLCCEFDNVINWY